MYIHTTYLTVTYTANTDVLHTELNNIITDFLMNLHLLACLLT